MVQVSLLSIISELSRGETTVVPWPDLGTTVIFLNLIFSKWLLVFVFFVIEKRPVYNCWCSKVDSVYNSSYLLTAAFWKTSTRSSVVERAAVAGGRSNLRPKAKPWAWTSGGSALHHIPKVYTGEICIRKQSCRYVLHAHHMTLFWWAIIQYYH